MLGNEKIDQINRFTYLGSIISKDGGCSEDIRCKNSEGSGCFFFTLKKVWKNLRIIMQTKIRILEARVMTFVKYGSEAWAL